MAYLIEKAGSADLVRDVAASTNFARIWQLADISELVDWVEANGLTLAEAAGIQPSYCGQFAGCVCDYVCLPDTLLEGVVSASEQTLGVVGVYGVDVGIVPGDSVPITTNFIASAGDLVLAKYGCDASFVGGGGSASSVEVSYTVINGSADLGGGCRILERFAPAPGPVPKDVVIQALLGECKNVLGAFDPAWTEWVGTCEGGAGGTGPATSTAGIGGAGGGGAPGVGGAPIGTGGLGGPPGADDGGGRSIPAMHTTVPGGGCACGVESGSVESGLGVLLLSVGSALLVRRVKTRGRSR